MLHEPRIIGRRRAGAAFAPASALLCRLLAKLRRGMLAVRDVLDVPVYWINLQAATARREAMEVALRGVARQTRVAGVTAGSARRMLRRGAVRLEDTAVVDVMTTSEPHMRHARRQVIFPELACTLSHLSAMEWAVHDNAGVALILEDDMNVSRLPERLAAPLSRLAHGAPCDWDVLQLHMLHSEKYEHLCKGTALFAPWEPDYWSTGAYLITHAAMRRLLNRTSAPGARVVPHPVVADHLLYSKANSYTLARPILATLRAHDTSIQPKAAQAALARGEDALWDGLLREGACAVGRVAAVDVTFLMLATAKVEEQYVQRRNAHALATAFGPRAAIAVVCPDRRCREWEAFRGEVSRALALRVTLVDDEYHNVGRFQSKFLAQVDALRMLSSYHQGLRRVLVLDGDIDLHRPSFDLGDFAAASAGATLTQPVVDVAVPTYLWGSQWFRPLNAIYWQSRRTAGLVRCAVPIVEQQVFLADAPFMQWFLDRPELQGIYDNQLLTPTDWGHDLLWCGAAREYNASAVPCAVVVTAEVYHLNTKTISKTEGYMQAGARMLGLLKGHRWFVDGNQAQAAWDRTGLRTCLARAALPAAQGLR